MYYCFFFKQKTAYEMRISDWSSDVCSSDLIMDALAAVRSRDRASLRERGRPHAVHALLGACGGLAMAHPAPAPDRQRARLFERAHGRRRRDRKSVGSGKGVSVRVDLGGGRMIQKNQESNQRIINK